MLYVRGTTYLVNSGHPTAKTAIAHNKRARKCGGIGAPLMLSGAIGLLGGAWGILFDGAPLTTASAVWLAVFGGGFITGVILLKVRQRIRNRVAVLMGKVTAEGQALSMKSHTYRTLSNLLYVMHKVSLGALGDLDKQGTFYRKVLLPYVLACKPLEGDLHRTTTFTALASVCARFELQARATIAALWDKAEMAHIHSVSRLEEQIMDHLQPAGEEENAAPSPA